MDFADYVDLATFLNIRDTFQDFRRLCFMNKKEEQTAEMVRESVISNRMAVFGAPGIMVVDMDSVFIGRIFQDFRNARNIVLQAVIPGDRILGAAERRRGLFRTTIIDYVIGNKKPKNSSNKEWKSSRQWRRCA